MNGINLFGDLKDDALLNGLTSALDNLTVLVEEQFRTEVMVFEKKWETIESTKEQEELLSRQCNRFLNRLSDFRGEKVQASEIASALYHPSIQINFSNVFRRGKIKGNVRRLPSFHIGKQLVDAIIALHLFESDWTLEHSVGAYANATKYLGSPALAEKFWSDLDLGLPFLGRGDINQKWLLDTAYKKLVHAIFLYEDFGAARKFVLKSLNLNMFLEVFADEIEFGDPKTLLQEFYQDRGLKPPVYSYVRDPETPDHEPIFHIRMLLPSIGEISAVSDSKKNGSVKLAEIAIQKLKKNKSTSLSMGRLLDKKRRSSLRAEMPSSQQSIPKEVVQLASEIKRMFGVEPDYFRLLQALKTKSKGRSKFESVPNNEMISKVGASLLECAISSSSIEFAAKGVEAVHPRLCDVLIEKLDLKNASRAIYKPILDWGINTDRQIAQSVIFAVFVKEERDFFDIMSVWLKSQPAFFEASSLQKGSYGIPSKFDEQFSYLTVLQEFVQKSSQTLPTYTKVTQGPVHVPIHKAICTYDGNSTSGQSNRFVWAKNAAAFKMLKLLDYPGLD